MYTFEITEDDIAMASEKQGSCPPKDTYLAEIIEAPEPEWKAGYKGIGQDLSNKISFRLMDYDWDYPITGFFTWQRKGKDGRLNQTMLNEKSKTNALLVATTGQLPYAGMKFSMNDLLHKRVKLVIDERENGFPEIKQILPLSARDEARLDTSPAPSATSAPAPVAPASSVSRRTLKKINDLAGEKGYTPDMLDALADKEFGVAFNQLTDDEANEFLDILKEEDAINF